MQKRTVHVMVLTFLLAVTVAAAFFLWNIQRRSNELRATEDAFVERLEGLSDTIGAMGMAQQGYVAPGQLNEPWFERMSTLLDQLNRDLAAVRLAARSADAGKAFVALADSRNALVAADERIRENLTHGQELMAADIIFSDGRNAVDALMSTLDEVQRAERNRTRVEVAALEQERWSVLGLATLVLFGVVLTLIRVSAPSVATSIESAERRDTRLAVSDTPGKTGRPVDLAAAAALCTDLSRVSETAALSELLGRAAALLDASGATLWLGAGDQLFAVLGHGYSQQTLARFGPIARDGDNAVAKAWRTGRLATVRGNGTTASAIVAPMFGPGGCIGVLALESRPASENDPALQAVAAMITAQLATAVSAWPAASGATLPNPSEARPA